MLRAWQVVLDQPVKQDRQPDDHRGGQPAVHGAAHVTGRETEAVQIQIEIVEIIPEQQLAAGQSQHTRAGELQGGASQPQSHPQKRNRLGRPEHGDPMFRENDGHGDEQKQHRLGQQHDERAHTPLAPPLQKGGQCEEDERVRHRYNAGPDTVRTVGDEPIAHAEGQQGVRRDDQEAPQSIDPASEALVSEGHQGVDEVEDV